MTRQIEAAAPPSIDLRTQTIRFESDTRDLASERIRIELDLPDGAARVWADPAELDELFFSLVVNVGVTLAAGGRLTIQLAPDDLENMPDEELLADRSRWMHVAIEDHGLHPVGVLFRRLLDPLVSAAALLAPVTGSLRWSGRVLTEEQDEFTRIIHLVLPYGAEREAEC